MGVAQNPVEILGPVQIRLRGRTVDYFAGYNVTMKQCITCKQNLALECFPPNKKNKDGLNVKCRDCFNSYMREWYQKNADKHKARVALSRNKELERARRYGLTAKDVDDMLAKWTVNLLVTGWLVLIGLGVFWVTQDPNDWQWPASITITLVIFYTGIVAGSSMIAKAIEKN